MRHLSLPVVLIVAAGLTACGSSAPPAAETSAAATPPPIPVPQRPGDAGGLRYPDLYKSLALPEIDGGTVNDTGRQTTSLRDGLMITVTSNKTVEQARTFYLERLAAAGWTSAPQARGAMLPNMPVSVVTFTKDAMTYTATITSVPEGTRILLTVTGS